MKCPTDTYWDSAFVCIPSTKQVGLSFVSINEGSCLVVIKHELFSCKILYFTLSSEHQENKFTNQFSFHRLQQTQETSQKYQLSPEVNIEEELHLLCVTTHVETYFACCVYLGWDPMRAIQRHLCPITPTWMIPSRYLIKSIRTIPT